MSSPLMGRLIGGLFGLVFVLVNAGAAGTPWSWALRFLAAAAFVGVLLQLRRAGEVTVQPRSRAVPAYWTSVLLEVGAIVAGTRLLSSQRHGEYGVALVAVVVGLHFLPFSWAFRQPTFLTLGLALMVLGAAGATLGTLGAADAVIELVAGVASGLALLLYAAIPPKATS